MKHTLLRIFLLSLFSVLFHSQAKACHGVALSNYSVTVAGNTVTVNGSSDPATCGCGPYYMEVELRCLNANFSGAAPACNAVTWGTYPWYHSLLNVPNYTQANGWPDNCVLEPYTPIVINMATLCPGTTYFLRARERVCAGTAGPWTAATQFVTPGVPPIFSLTAAGNPTSVCPGNPTQLTATLNPQNACNGSGNPTFTWQPGNLIGQTVNVSPNVTTTYTVTAQGGPLTCYTVTPATVTITVLPPPSVGVASLLPAQVCAGGCVTLTLTNFSGNLQWQSSPNAIVWSNIPGATTNNYQFCPVNATMYFRAVITGAPGCGSATSNVITATVIPVPIVTINPLNPVICAGQSVTLTAAGGNGYNWVGPNITSGANTASMTCNPAVTSTYTVTTTGICPGTATMTVVVNPLPVITLASAAICNGDTAMLVAGSNANTYAWNPNIGLTWINAAHDSCLANPAATTTYTVTATSPAGCTATGNATLTINANPVLSLSASTLYICPNSTDTVFVSGATSYLWSSLVGANPLTPNNSDVEFNPPASATYTVTGTDPSGCWDTAVVNVIVTNVIVVDAGLPDSICPGQSTVLNASGGNNYVWSSNNPNAVIVNGNTANPTVTVSTTTMFTANITNQFGCFGVDSVEILVRPLPTPDAGADTSICIGSNVTLNGSGGGSYNWVGNNINSGGNTNTPNVSPASTSYYYMTVTDQFGCQATDSVQVTINQLPNVSAGADQFICGACATLIATGGSQYQWTPPIGLSDVNNDTTQACPQMSTNYVVNVTDGNGCISTDTVFVTVYPPLLVQASAAQSICPGGQANISAQAQGGDGGQYTYSWSPAAGLANPNAAATTASPATTTTYVVTASDACGSPVAIDSVVVSVFALPQLSIVPDVTEGCAPLCVNFVGNSNPAAANCSWDFNDGTGNGCNVSHCFNNAGSYSIIYTVTDLNGCTNSITAQNLITVHPVPVAGFTATPTVTSILTPFISITPNCVGCTSTSYTMGTSDSITNAAVAFSYEYDAPGSYTIVQTVTNQFGCSDVDSLEIIIEPDYSIYIPNAFTPNDDGLNDVFYAYPVGVDHDKFDLWIFDRWGNMIFYSDDPNKGWDGRVQGSDKLCQIDTYVWKVEFVDPNGGKHKLIGHVSLVD